MSSTATGFHRSSRTTGTRHVGPVLAVRAVVTLLILLGVSAMAGGVEMLLDINGGTYLPQSWLGALPMIDTFLLPGLVLLFVFGIGSLTTAYGMARRPQWQWLRGFERVTGHHWSWTATALLGVGQLLWITIELIYLPGLSWLQVVYGLIGLGLALSPWIAPIRNDLRV